MSDVQKGFWSSIPGILTGLAAVITALTGLYVAVDSSMSNEVTGKDHDNGNPVIIEQPVNGMTLKQPDPVASTVSLPNLVDCKLFPTVNTVASLMSWSNHYHKQVSHSVAIKDSCNKAIGYRAQAHCKKPQDLAIRQGLSETLSLCREADFDWKNVQL